jgi:2',3'-cyclic-nucleotide 2'-phosphodiesterase (5'-nucleotidase family)
MGSCKKFTIVQMNDSHAYLDVHQEIFFGPDRVMYRPAGGYARIATLLEQIRAESNGRVLFCDCGDTFHGTYLAQETRGQALVPILNSLNLDAATAHWEFAYGPRRLQQLASELNYPMLAINVYNKETDKLIFAPYIVKEIAGLKIGLIGIASNIVDKSMPPSYSEGLHFTLGREELPPIIDALRHKEKVDLIILVSHLGFPQDMRLLSEVQGVDVCLSGHTHNRLHRPALQGKTIIIQSGCHGSFLGRLDLETESGKIVKYQHHLIEVEAGIKPDSEVSELVEQALAPYKDALSEVVGETATALNRGTILESTMDNFLLQALIENSETQLAFSNGWRYGAPIVPGNVTLNDLYNIAPMNPPVSRGELTGEEICTMIEENLEHTFSRDPYQQMGGYVKRCLGLRVYFKMENPEGHRIQKLFVNDKEVQLHEYYAAVFITEQGVPQKYGRNRENLSDHTLDALQMYLEKHCPLRAEPKGTFVAV